MGLFERRLSLLSFQRQNSGQCKVMYLIHYIKEQKRNEIYLFINVSDATLVLPLRDSISPPTSCRRGQQATKNHCDSFYLTHFRDFSVRGKRSCFLGSTVFIFTSSQFYTQQLSTPLSVIPFTFRRLITEYFLQIDKKPITDIC